MHVARGFAKWRKFYPVIYQHIFSEVPCFQFWWQWVYYFSTFVLHMQAKFLILNKTQRQFSQPSSKPVYMFSPIWKTGAKINSEVYSVCKTKSTVLSSVSGSSLLTGVQSSTVSWVILKAETMFLNKLLSHPCSTASHAQIYVI